MACGDMPPTRKTVTNWGTGIVMDSQIDTEGVLAGDREERYFYAGWRVVEERTGGGDVIAQTVWGGCQHRIPKMPLSHRGETGLRRYEFRGRESRPNRNRARQRIERAPAQREWDERLKGIPSGAR
ncbi:MAG: hypothetical protein KDA32_13960 [Phycisphaerales bacterium]|nr:hypothetical protein [Phycisphaerales bacterium]